jgi:osmoprotectant transport system ATP-binding protein
MPASLSARDVVHRYGSAVALDGVSIDVAAGASLALVGESGSGKTTLLRCFNRMIEPTSGAVRVGDADVRTQEPVALRRRLGYVPQDGGLLPHWRVARNVALVPTLAGRDDARALAESALALVGLPVARYGARFPHELSGGQRQRVALARALAARPEVILLDEPFGAVDAISRADLQSAFADVRREVGVTTLLVTHDLAEAARLGDDVAVMRAGRIEQCAPFATLAAAPATEYVATLIARAIASAAALRTA